MFISKREYENREEHISFLEERVKSFDSNYRRLYNMLLCLKEDNIELRNELKNTHSFEIRDIETGRKMEARWFDKMNYGTETPQCELIPMPEIKPAKDYKDSVLTNEQIFILFKQGYKDIAGKIDDYRPLMKLDGDRVGINIYMKNGDVIQYFPKEGEI